MAYSPKPAGPKNLREFFHYLWKNLSDIGTEIGDEGATLPPDPVPDPGHQHWHDNLVNVTTDQHHPQLHNIDSHTDVTAAAPDVRDILAYDGAGYVLDRRTTATGSYVPNNIYLRGEEVSDGGNLSECVADGTTSEPYIEPVGTPEFVYSGVGMANDPQLASQIVFGQRYQNNTQPIYISAYRVNVVAGNDYTVSSISDPLGTPVVTQLVNFVPSITGWIEFTVSPLGVPQGTLFDIVAVVSEPDPTPVEVDATYDYSTPQNAVNPTAGQIVHGRSQSDQMRISYTDDVAGDRTVLIQSLSIGDLITDGIIQWSVQSNSDQGTWALLGVAPATVSAAGIKTFTFSTVAPTPISVPVELAYWAGSSFPNVQGLISVDDTYPNATLNDNAYGVDIKVQPAYLPDPAEWLVKIIGDTASSVSATTLSEYDVAWLQATDVAEPFTITGDYTVVPTDTGIDIVVVCNNTVPITITMPLLSLGQKVTIIRGNTGSVTIDGDGALITGELTQTLPARHDVADLVGTAIGWLLT